jgi:hypothetical protein
MEDQFVIAEDATDAGPSSGGVSSTGGKGGKGGKDAAVATGGASTGGASTGGASTGGAPADAGLDVPSVPDTAIACGVPTTAPGANCPPGCECPDATTCIIRCMGNESCRDKKLQCPPNRNCEVVCEGDKACEKADVKCAGAGSCNVICGGGACKALKSTCTNGPCTLSCLFGCESATLHCGSNSCDALCGVGPLPKVECGASCDCTSC